MMDMDGYGASNGGQSHSRNAGVSGLTAKRRDGLAGIFQGQLTDALKLAVKVLGHPGSWDFFHEESGSLNVLISFIYM